jgi:hypothetical protein
MRCTTYTSSSSREKRQHARASYGQQAQRLHPSPVLRPYHRVALYGFVCLCVICCVLQYIAICVCVFMILCHTDVKTPVTRSPPLPQGRFIWIRVSLCHMFFMDSCVFVSYVVLFSTLPYVSVSL